MSRSTGMPEPTGGNLESDRECLLPNEDGGATKGLTQSINDATINSQDGVRIGVCDRLDITRQDQSDGGNDPLKKGQDGDGNQRKPSGFVVYRSRWYVLTMFCTMAFLQACYWNTWGPIENTAMAVLGWNEGQIALLANWGCITFIVSAFFFTWLLNSKGLRVAVLVAGGLMVFGAGLRCIPVPIPMMKWTVHTGHIFIGLSGPVMMGAVTSVSATWFPVNERITATGLSSTIPYLGIGASFLIGPLIVGEYDPSSTTISPLTTLGLNVSSEELELFDKDEKNLYLQNIRLLMYIEFAVNAVVYVALLIYFPAAPKTPPTASAQVQREDLKTGLIALVKKSSFWIPSLAYAFSGGTFDGWLAQFSVIFQGNINQTDAGWLGFYINVASLVGGVAVSRFADYLGGKMKTVILILLTASCASLIWATLLANHYIPFSKGALYASVISFGLFVNSTVPLFFELTVENAFPIGEETTTICMTFLFNVFSLLFLILPMIPSFADHLSWLNWFILGATACCIPLMLFYKEHYNRLGLDTKTTESNQDQDETIQQNQEDHNIVSA